MGAYAFPIIQYGTFFVFLTMALLQFFKVLWSTDERVYIKNRFIRTMKSQQNRFLKVKVESESTKLFRAAGFYKMSDLKWLLIRFLLILVGALYLVYHDQIRNAVIYIALIYIATEVYIKFSPITLYLKRRNRMIQQRKELELFTLFALMKTDLMASNHEQVNVYHLVSETTPYFKEINHVLVRFLALWKKSPEEAGTVFQKELEGETADFLGDVLSKLHNVNRKDALHLLSEQGEAFSYKPAELAVQRAEGKRHIYFALFFTSSFVGIAWFMYFCYAMVAESMNF